MSGFTNITGFAPPNSAAGFLGLLQTAVFRGVPFKVVAAQVKKGRRLALHEYPFRDGGWAEDMGRALRTYSFSGYLIGDAAPVMQLLLDNAIEAPGPGLLIHPTLGAVRVAVLSASTAVHKDRMRVVEVAFEFVEQGDSVLPGWAVATAVAVLAAADAALEASGGDLGTSVASAAAEGPAVTAEGSAVVGRFAGRARLAGADPTAIIGMAAGLPPPDSASTYGRYAGGSASTLLPDGTTVASLQASVAAQRAALAAAAKTAVTAAASFTAATDMPGALAALLEAMRAGITDPAGQVRALLALAGFACADNAGAAVAVMRDGMAAACRRAALASLARASASYRPASYDDAAALRAEIAAAFDSEATAAADAGQDATYRALKALRAAVVQDLTVRGASLPTVTGVAFAVPLPSLVIGQILYRDAGRSDGIAAESGAVHPAFCPVAFRALASGMRNPVVAAAPSGRVLLPRGGTTGPYQLPPPGPPAGLSVGTVTLTTAALSWSAPTGGGLATGFSVAVSTDGGATWAPFAATAGAGYTVSGLSSDTAYVFQVTATNAAGASLPAGPVAAATLARAPGPATGLAAATGTPGASAMLLSWAAPAVDAAHDAASGYAVSCGVAGSGSLTAFATVAGTFCAVTGLSRATWYDFAVVATNSGGASDGKIAVRQTLALAPNPATGLVAAAGSPASGAVALSWTAPVADASHDAAATYVPSFRPSGTAGWTLFAGSTTGTSVTVTGLSAATAYDFQVTAANSGGSAPGSAPASLTTASAPPNDVTGLAAGTSTATTVPLSWSAPVVDSSHSPATGYAVSCRINGSSVWAAAASGVTGTGFTVAGLIAGQAYQFRVAATNAAGASPGVAVTVATGAAGGSLTCWGTGGYPTAAVAHGSTTVIVAFVTNAGSIASASFGWSATQYDPPASLQPMTAFNPGLFGSFSAATPAAAGSYHGWMVFYDAGGNALLAVVSDPSQHQQGGAAVMDPVTVT